MKLWVRFAGGVLVVTVLYLDAGADHVGTLLVDSRRYLDGLLRYRACLSQATRMLPWARPRAELFRTDTSDLCLLRLNAVPSPSLAETEAGQS